MQGILRWIKERQAQQCSLETVRQLMIHEYGAKYYSRRAELRLHCHF